MKYAVMSQMHCTQPTMYKFFCLKIDIKNKADSYMPCEAMAHSTKLNCVETSVILIRRKIYWVCTATYPRISEDLTMLFLLVKVLKGPIYANRLADFASVFQDRQKEIRMALLLHTATSLDSVRDTLADVHRSVRLTGEKLNMIALFHKL